MERESDTLPRMGVGNYVTADPSRGSKAIFWTFYEGAAGSPSSCRMWRGTSFKAVGRTGVLQSCAEYADRSKNSDGGVSGRTSGRLWKTTDVKRNRSLYGRCNCFDRLWDTGSGGGWQCTAGHHEDHSRWHRYYEAGVSYTNGAAVERIHAKRSGECLQSGIDGIRSNGLCPEWGAGLWQLPCTKYLYG